MAPIKEEKMKNMKAVVPNDIVAYLHCKKCLEERPPELSPMEWSRVQVGWTVKGIQIWCNRHELNVMHMDFEGVKHPAI
jgi:hypothetical protein